jgi:hypothetical protein
LLLAWVLAAAVIVGVVATEGDQANGKRIRLLDIAALGVALAVAVGVTRGALSADARESSGDRTLLLVLPGLVCFVAAVAAARVLGPVMRLAERLSRRGMLAVRLAFLALARAPSRTAAAGAFLVIAVGLILFASSYHSTLERGARDEAAFAVPLDVTLSEGARLVAPLEATSIDRLEHLAPGVAAHPVVRRAAGIVGLGSAVQTATVVGVPSRALADMHWRSDFSSVPQDALAHGLLKDASLRLRGPEIPPDAETVQVRAHVEGTPLRIDVVIRDASNRIEIIPLGKATSGSSVLAARLPRERPGARPRRVIGLQLSLPGDEKDWFLFVARERREVRAPSGSLRLEPLIVSSRTAKTQLTDWRGWITRGRGTRTAAAGRIAFSFPEIQTIVVRPSQPTDKRALSAIVSPLVADAAGPDGRLTLNLFDSQVDVRVIATARRFRRCRRTGSSSSSSTRPVCTTAVDADAPGSATPLELWLAVPSRAADAVTQLLDQPPFSDLEGVSRRDLLARRTHDPLARAVGYTLQVAALLALALAVIGVWVTLLGELRDERGDFFDLEAQGVEPNTLRWHLRLRTYALFVFGIAEGCCSASCWRAVISLVQISVTAALRDPPLVFEPGWTAVGLTLTAFAVAAVLAAELSVRHAFRGDTPQRASWTLE